MKLKIILLLLGVYSCFSAFAQTEKRTEKKYKWGCAFTINSVEAQIGDPELYSWGYAASNIRLYGDVKNKSISISIIPKYFISKDVLLRVEFGMTKINMTNFFDNNAHASSNSATIHTTFYQSIIQDIFRYAGGVQWNFFHYKFLEVECGLTAVYHQYNEMKYHDEFRSLDLSQNDLYIGGLDEKSVASGGFALGAGVLLGVNIFLQKNVSIGCEFSSAFEYKNLGGKYGGEVIQIHPPDSPEIQTFYYNANSFKGYGFSKILSSFNLYIRL